LYTIKQILNEFLDLRWCWSWKSCEIWWKT